MKLDRRLLRLAHLGRAALFVTVASGLAGGLLMILQAWWLTGVINAVFLAGLEFGAVRSLVFFLLGVILLRSALAWLGEVAANRAAGQIKAGLRRRLLAHLFVLGPLSLTSAPSLEGRDVSSQSVRGEGESGELVHALTEGIEALDAYFSQYLPQIALSVLLPASILLVVFPLDPLSGLILLLTGPLIPFFMVLIGSQADAETKKQWQLLSRLSARFLDALQGLVTLKILGRSQDFATDLARAGEQYRQKTMDVLRVTFLSALALELLATISTALVAVQIGLRLLYGQISFEQAFFVLLLAPEFYAPLRQLGLRFHAGMAGAVAGERIFQILEQKPPSTGSRADETHHASPVILPAHTIHFDHVSYTYPDGTPALQDVTFTLQPGTITALTGPSGSGKSTLVSLLLGFIQPTSGQIKRLSLDDVYSSPLDSQQSAISNHPFPIAWVPQHPYLFNDSIAANLRLSNPAAGDADLAAAAQLAHVDEFIRSLPQGHETVIGERGARLSGGQAQRLALARAFLMDAPLLILDEPTAHLDPLTETALLESARRLAKDRIVLLIAHRPATIAAANQVITCQRSKVESQQPPPTTFDLRPSTPLPHTTFDPSIHSGQALRPFDILRAGSSTLPSPLPWLFSFLAPFAPMILLSALLGFATVAAAMGLMGTSAYLIAAAALHPSIAALQVAIVGVRFFGLSRGVFRYLERLVSHDVTFRVLARLRTWFYRAVEPLAPGGLANIHSGDLLGRVIADINLLENFYVRSAAPPLVALLIAVAAAGFVGIFDLRLAITLLIFLALQGIAAPIWLLLLGKAPGGQLLAARSRLNVLLVDALQGMADLLACRASERWLASVDAAGQSVIDLQARMAQLNGLQSALGVLLANLGMLSVVVMATPLVAAGRFEGVWLPVLVLLALASFEALLPLPQTAAHLETHRQAAARLLALASQPPAVVEPINPLPVPDTFTIDVNDLSFNYPPGSPFRVSANEIALYPISQSSDFPALPAPVLADISFTLPPGKRLAIVGPSGAGKSTLLNLLLRFYDFSTHLSQTEFAGITLNSRPLDVYSSTSLRDRIAVVSQHTYLFSATIRENLLLARPDANAEQIESAARSAQIHEWVTSLPQGYDTWVGEHGLRLSGGERQRLAIARALLRDAPLLLLDEPTAHLDTATEASLLEVLRALMAERSVVWATHRLAGLDWMDEILVLDDGRVVERGSHEALLAQVGLYRRMWEVQNARL